MSRIFVGSTVCAGLALAAAADAQTFDVQQFHSGASQRTAFFDVPSAQILGHLGWEVGLMLDYARSPLVLQPPGDADVLDIVGGQFTSSFGVALGLFDRVELGLVLPMILAQPGDDLRQLGAANAPDPGFGVGDIRVTTAVQILGPGEDGGFALALEIPIWLPSGDVAVYQGDQSARVEPRAVAEYVLGSGVHFGGALGVQLRHAAVVQNVDVDETFTFGVGAGIPVGPIELIGELAGESRFGVDNSVGEEVPLATNLGVRYAAGSGVIAQGGFGVGLNEGFGTPRYRLFFGVAYGPGEVDGDPDADGLAGDADRCPHEAEDVDLFEDEDGCPDTDNDRDRVSDVDDACPNEPEDIDGFEDENGCPEPDNDGDGVLDPDDACPLIAEDTDGVDDLDGCPDGDNDGDGVLDPDDACAAEPEDIDEFEDENGCPDPDNDRDGLLDGADACPLEPEDYDGVEDDNGCPEEASGQVTLRCDRIEIADAIYFDTNSDVIQARSHGLLDQVAGVLRGATYVRLVRIDGHTDDRGSDVSNLDLSNRRAAAVLRYLVAAGVEESRLRSEGFGETRPIVENTTPDNLARNRRVEFRIVETDAACEAPATE